MRPFAMPLFGLVIALFFLFPYLVMLVSSFKDDADLFASPATYLPTTWQWENWIEIWSRIDLAGFLKNSLIIAVVSTAIVLVVSIPAAYFSANAV